MEPNILIYTLNEFKVTNCKIILVINTIFVNFFQGLVANWASEASPTQGCSIEILRDIYMSVGMSVVAQNA